ncbi:MAG: DUF6754 domain-containing protein [Candidatus Bathyarchaeia archaeon]
MQGLVEGRTAQAVLLVIVLVAIYELSRFASKRKLKTRGIPGLERIDGWIKEAAKLGRSVFYTPGTGSIASPDTLAALALLEYVAEHCVEHDARLLVGTADVNVQQVAEDIVKTAYTKAGKGKEFMADTVRYLSARQFAFAAGVMGILRREKPAVNFFVGDFSAEALEIAEAGRTEAIAQFGGTSNVDQLPFFMATCDQTLIGEELYTAQGYLSTDPEAISTLVGPDAGKFLAILLILLGALFITFGNPILADLLQL